MGNSGIYEDTIRLVPMKLRKFVSESIKGLWMRVGSLAEQDVTCVWSTLCFGAENSPGHWATASLIMERVQFGTRGDPADENGEARFEVE